MVVELRTDPYLPPGCTDADVDGRRYRIRFPEAAEDREQREQHEEQNNDSQRHDD